MLRFKAVHVHRELGNAFDIREIEKFPTLELRAIREICVFGERVVLPAAGIFDGLTAPDACGAIEIEKSAAAGARAMFDDKMSIEEDGFNLRKEGIVAVEVGPASLDHPDLVAALGIQKIGNRAAEEILLRNEVSVENGDELALRGFQAVFEGAGLVTFAVCAMDVRNPHALCSVALDAAAGDLLGFVGGVVENLDIEELARIVETRHGFDKPLDDVALVEDGKLDRDAGPAGNGRRRSGNIFRIFVVVVHKPIAMQAVQREDAEDQEVGNHHREIEGVGVINAAEGSVGNLVPVMADGTLLRKSERE